jgi:hypothetical protein
MRKLAWIAVLMIGCSKPAEKAPPADQGQVESAAGHAAGSAGEEKAHHRKHEDRRDPVVANAPPLKLVVSVQGQATTWDQAAFDKVAKYTKGTDGEARDVWSLRELVHGLVGPEARVATVTGEDGTKAIDAAAWQDEAKTPLLHTTRRGTLKFRWADASGTWGESEVKDVAKIEIAP